MECVSLAKRWAFSILVISHLCLTPLMANLEDCKGGLSEEGARAQGSTSGAVRTMVETYADLWQEQLEGKAVNNELQQISSALRAQVVPNGPKGVQGMVTIALDDREDFSTRITALELLAQLHHSAYSAQEALRDELQTYLPSLLLSLKTPGENNFADTLSDSRMLFLSFYGDHDNPLTIYVVRLYQTLFAISNHPEDDLEDFAKLMEEVYADPIELSGDGFDPESFVEIYNRQLKFTCVATRALSELAHPMASRLIHRVYDGYRKRLEEEQYGSAIAPVPLWVQAMIVEASEANRYQRTIPKEIYPLVLEAFDTMLDGLSARFFKAQMFSLTEEHRIIMVALLGAVHRYELEAPEFSGKLTLQGILHKGHTDLVNGYGNWEMEKLELATLAMATTSELDCPPAIARELLQVLDGAVYQLDLFAKRAHTDDRNFGHSLAIRFVNLVQPLYNARFARPGFIANAIRRSYENPYLADSETQSVMEWVVTSWDETTAP